MAKYIFICKKCGSTDIQIRCDINPNTNEILNSFEELQCWCNNCKKISQPIKKCWVNPNTNEIIDDCGEKECWCEKCQEHQRYECIEIEE